MTISYTRLLIGISAILLCGGFGSQTSEDSPAKQRVNYYGTYIDNKGEKHRIDNISIDGKIYAIPFYEDSNKNEDPHNTTTYLDLDKIDTIEPAMEPHCKNSSAIFHYRSSPFIRLNVKLKGAEKSRTYALETTKKVSCQVITSAGEVHRDIAFEGIKKLTIIDVAPRSYNQLQPQAAQCTQAQEDIQKLQQQIEQEPDVVKKGFMQETLDNLKSLITSWCS